ncbi:MAG: M17 family metallopeptidase [Paracoccaceae bacterium]
MSLSFAAPTADAIPVHVVDADAPDAVLSTLSGTQRNWAKAQGFSGGAGAVLSLPTADGTTDGVLIGAGDAKARARKRFIVGGAAASLPEGTYRLAGDHDPQTLEEIALGWLLNGYHFTRYAGSPPKTRGLVAPEGIDVARIEALAAGEALTRDLINTPASDMGPAELEDAARALADQHGAKMSVVTGDDLLTANFPMIHTVGRASIRQPRLIDIRWGEEGPTLTLVGKGVCFDTGGLNIKPGSSMGLMKKDMGGAATVLGLAHMIMATGAKVRLRVLIPAVENSIDANAFRPQDILTSRKGLTVEINNTDAEGRLVLADALALADEEKPDLIVSMATLTGAARVAVGGDLSPFFTDHDGHASALSAAAGRVADPVWRLPFHAPYEAMIEPGIADLDNAPSGGKAGAITAALFLRRFVENAPYMHFDVYGWNDSAAPARSKGGACMGARALFEALPDMLSS